jgi:hypothetical protein
VQDVVVATPVLALDCHVAADRRLAVHVTSAHVAVISLQQVVAGVLPFAVVSFATSMIFGAAQRFLFFL